MEDRFSLKSYIRPLTEFPRSDDTETIGTVLKLASSCHHPVFILNKKEEFMGFVTAYQVLYRQSFPYMTKVSHCFIKAPHITESTSLSKVMELARDLAVYSLPIYDASKKKVIGAVRIKDILKGIIKDRAVLEYLSQVVKPKDVTTADLDVQLRDLQDLFKYINTSRIVLINTEGQVAGIVTRQDLADVFLNPTEIYKYSRGGNVGAVSYSSEERYRNESPVKKYMNETVYTESLETDIKSLIRNLIHSEYNSVIIVDIQNKPLAYITLRDIIDAFAGLPKGIEIPILFKKPSDSVSESELSKGEDLLYKFLEKFNKKQAIIKVEMMFKEPKYTDRDTAEFDGTLVVDTSSGIRYVAHSRADEFLDCVRAAISEIEKQEERRPRKRANEYTKQQLLQSLSQ